MKNLNKTLLLLAIVFSLGGTPTTYAADTATKPLKSQTPAQQRAASFSKTDLNGDGSITRDEFADFNHLSSVAPTSDQDIRATRILGAFQEMDKDADGQVSAKEYTAYMEKIGG